MAARASNYNSKRFKQTDLSVDNRTVDQCTASCSFEILLTSFFSIYFSSFFLFYVFDMVKIALELTP